MPIVWFPWGTTPKVSCCPSSARAKRRLASGKAGLRGIDDSGAKIEFAHLSAGFEVDDRDGVVIDTRCDQGLAIGGDGEVGDGGFLVNADAGIVAERNGRAVFRPSAGQSKHMDVVVHSAGGVEARSIGREDDSEERVGT